MKLYNKVSSELYNLFIERCTLIQSAMDSGLVPRDRLPGTPGHRGRTIEARKIELSYKHRTSLSENKETPHSDVNSHSFIKVLMQRQESKVCFCFFVFFTKLLHFRRAAPLKSQPVPAGGCGAAER